MDYLGSGSMKENRNPNIKKQTLKVERNITLYLQLLLLFLMIILGICYLFSLKTMTYLIISAMAFLWVGAYNSYKYLGKKKMAILYIGASLLLFLNLLGI